MNQYFKFKQFVVYQEKAAMKLTTDSVLLGAWAECSEAKTILDIGTGTGILALMMAQKYPEAEITAVEIDQESYRQAKYNFEISPWKERFRLIYGDIKKVAFDKKFDCIICNPPYYQHYLRSEEQKNNMAKHNVTLTYEQFAMVAAKLIAKKGKIFTIVPYNFAQELNNFFNYNMLFCKQRLDVCTVEGKKPTRVLMEFIPRIEVCQTNVLYIRTKNGHYSEAYRNLTKDFYLYF